eukprot:c6165_g1_i1.p1 GENE.c6165_g1_i1~~c6165_g1_i1.p1  ORF type:complete len:265 (-),score=19.67 c6165_g1_i1:164-958(-)
MITSIRVADLIFTALVVLLMCTMKMPKRGTLPSVLHNITFWIYVGFWVKAISNIARVPLVWTNVGNQEYITIWFNLTGSLIVTLSIVLPCEFVYHYRKYGALVPMSMKNRLVGCLVVVLVYCALLAVTVLVISFDVTNAGLVLLIWRLFFFLNAIVECVLLCWNLMIVRRFILDHDRFQSIQRHLLVTLYMRGGIAATLVLKIFHVVEPPRLAIAHQWFVFSGLLAYHIRLAAAETRPQVHTLATIRPATLSRIRTGSFLGSGS